MLREFPNKFHQNMLNFGKWRIRREIPTICETYTKSSTRLKRRGLTRVETRKWMIQHRRKQQKIIATMFKHVEIT